MANNKKAYNIICIFEYLAVFKTEKVAAFFNHYIINHHWENDTINNIVYTYNGYK